MNEKFDSSKYNLSLRRAKLEDAEFLFILRNDKTVRENSFQTNVIAYEQHLNWYKNKMQDEKTQIYILQINKQNTGQVRVDEENSDLEISYAICQEYRGKGYAKWMLGTLEKELRKVENNIGKCLVGDVKKDNISSQKVFLSLGYIESKMTYGFQYRKRI